MQSTGLSGLFLSMVRFHGAGGPRAGRGHVSAADAPARGRRTGQGPWNGTLLLSYLAMA